MIIWRDEIEENNKDKIVFINCGKTKEPINKVGPDCAEAQIAALSAATDAMLSNAFSALVTAPVAKNAISSIIPNFTGHTEYLAERSGLQHDDVTMMFAADNLNVGLVSTHVAMSEVPAMITHKRLLRTFTHVAEMLKLSCANKTPKIAIAALNPHAGEDGMFGSEEITIIQPFCEEAKKLGIADVFGPLPADTLYRDAMSGQFDGVVAAYHDQALIPLKLGGVGQTVNVTMGLPFIRTSPDHGTAYNIARKGLADPAGFQTALKLAVKLASNKV